MVEAPEHVLFGVVRENDEQLREFATRNHIDFPGVWKARRPVRKLEPVESPQPPFSSDVVAICERVEGYRNEFDPATTMDLVVEILRGSDNQA